MKIRTTVQKPKAVKGLKAQTSVKAGEFCWSAYRDAYHTGRSQDWDKFYDCCRQDGSCMS
jgi:hypothetical protein